MPGDEAALRDIDTNVTRVLVDHHRAFLRFLERRVGSREVAEDILQEAFARGLGKIEELRDDEAAVAWFYRTLRNATIDYWRRKGAGDRAMEQFAKEVETSEEPLEEMRAEVCKCVATLADTLKPEYADALKRIEVDGIAVKDFADEQGISASNAAVRIFRAREALRKSVATSCGTCAEHGCLNCTCGKPC